MKRISYVLGIIIILFCISNMATADFKFRLMGGSGYTVSDLGSTIESTDVTSLKITLQGHLQLVYNPVDFLAFGADVGLMHLWTWTYYGTSGTTWMANTLGFVEFNISSFVLQVGGGAYFSIADKTDSNSAGGIDNGYGIMAAMGAELPLEGNLYIPVMIRADFIWASVNERKNPTVNKDKLVIPISFMAGITYKF